MTKTILDLLQQEVHPLKVGAKIQLEVLDDSWAVPRNQNDSIVI